MAFLLHHLLSETAAKHPDREAIVFQSRGITYAELDRETAKMAGLLRTHLTGRGDRIGIYMNRGIDSIIAALGILKAGAIYVPIDPLSPIRRLEFIMAQCGIRTLVTCREKLNNVEQALVAYSHLEKVVVMDGIEPLPPASASRELIDWRMVSIELCDNVPELEAIDTDPAYILFTSGSTGNPKGVTISHLNSLSFIHSACAFFNVQKEDRFSNICPLHFDMSVFDIYVALKAAASVVIIPETCVMFPVKLAEIIASQKISVWNSVPSALSLLASHANLSRLDLSSMRLILFAGEQFPVKYLRRLQEILPKARFCNMYGQTEANSSTYYWVDKLPQDYKGPLPIGKPLPNFEVFAIDDSGKRVDSTDNEGELYVRASTVALGYWGEHEKTRKSFVPNPLNPGMHERVYKTGDMVRLDANGNYVFLGRKDFMIKSRGYRIEIGEIETILCNHPEIKNAVVVAIPDDLIGNRISAIIEPMSPGVMHKDSVVHYCAAQLPKYMVPEIIEFRDSLPTTSSGKVDRKILSKSLQIIANSSDSPYS